MQFILKSRDIEQIKSEVGRYENFLIDKRSMRVEFDYPRKHYHNLGWREHFFRVRLKTTNKDEPEKAFYSGLVIHTDKYFNDKYADVSDKDYVTLSEFNRAFKSDNWTGDYLVNINRQSVDRITVKKI